MRAALIVAFLVGSAAADAPPPPPENTGESSGESTVNVHKGPVAQPHPDQPPQPAAGDPFAEFTGANPAARDLFNEARTLRAAGNQTDACAKLAASWKLEEATATEVGLASCKENEGKFAEARRLYESAAMHSRQSGFEDRARAATERAAALDDKLAIVVIKLAEPVAKGTVVTVNDQLVETAPVVRAGVDAGNVTVTAKGPTGVTSTRTFRVFLHTTTNVEVPSLVERRGGRKPVWIAGSVVLGLGGLIALGAGSGAVQFVGGGAILAGITVFLLAPRERVTVVPMMHYSGGAGVALVGRF